MKAHSARVVTRGKAVCARPWQAQPSRAVNSSRSRGTLGRDHNKYARITSVQHLFGVLLRACLCPCPCLFPSHGARVSLSELLHSPRSRGTRADAGVRSSSTISGLSATNSSRRDNQLLRTQGLESVLSPCSEGLDAPRLRLDALVLAARFCPADGALLVTGSAVASPPICKQGLSRCTVSLSYLVFDSRTTPSSRLLLPLRQRRRDEFL